MIVNNITFNFCITLMLPSLVMVGVAAAKVSTKDCHGKICNPIEEYCSAFSEGCDKCSNICDHTSHNHHPDTCAKLCAEYNKFDPLKTEIHLIQSQQNIMLILLIVLLALITIRYVYKSIRWLRNKRCISHLLQKLQPKKNHNMQTNNAKDIGGTTISNVMAINDIERAPSQIYSVTGAEGSVLTMTTPVSTRYPAENSTTPTTIPLEYSYDNQALAVTPIVDKPNGTQVF